MEPEQFPGAGYHFRAALDDVLPMRTGPLANDVFIGISVPEHLVRSPWPSFADLPAGIDDGREQGV